MGDRRNRKRVRGRCRAHASEPPPTGSSFARPVDLRRLRSVVHTVGFQQGALGRSLRRRSFGKPVFRELQRKRNVSDHCAPGRRRARGRDARRDHDQALVERPHWSADWMESNSARKQCGRYELDTGPVLQGRRLVRFRPVHVAVLFNDGRGRRHRCLSRHRPGSACERQLRSLPSTHGSDRRSWSHDCRSRYARGRVLRRQQHDRNRAADRNERGVRADE